MTGFITQANLEMCFLLCKISMASPWAPILNFVLSSSPCPCLSSSEWKVVSHMDSVLQVLWGVGDTILDLRLFFFLWFYRWREARRFFLSKTWSDCCMVLFEARSWTWWSLKIPFNSGYSVVLLFVVFFACICIPVSSQHPYEAVTVTWAITGFLNSIECFSLYCPPEWDTWLLLCPRLH